MRANSLLEVFYVLQDNKEKIIAYASRKLSDAEKHHGITKKEMLTVICSVRQFKLYLRGEHFEIRYDHQALLPMLTSDTEGSNQLFSMESGIGSI